MSSWFYNRQSQPVSKNKDSSKKANNEIMRSFRISNHTVLNKFSGDSIKNSEQKCFSLWGKKYMYLDKRILNRFPQRSSILRSKPRNTASVWEDFENKKWVIVMGHAAI